jgi:NAD+ synthase
MLLLVEERYSAAEAIEAGFSPTFVERVTGLIRRHHFKRTMPVIPRLGGRSIGHDFRYLRDAAV